MDNGVIYKIAENNPNMSDIDRLVNIYWALSSTLVAGVRGEVVEVGCNSGKTSVFLQMLIDHFDEDRRLHVYDSFEGLPKPSDRDAYLEEGDCQASIEELKAEFVKWNLRYPEIHKGWFEDVLPKSCPDEIAFAYLDGDFYDSIMVSLQFVYPRLSKNGIIIVDDYGDAQKNPQAWLDLPGVKLACDDYFRDKDDSISVLVGTGDLPFGMVRKSS